MNDKKLNSSIVFKLKTWHLSQVFGHFFWINTLIILLSWGALLYHTEQTAARSAPPEESTVRLYQTVPKTGVIFPEMLNFAFPEPTRQGMRQIVAVSGNSSFPEWLESIRYRIWLPANDMFYCMEYNIGMELSLFAKLFIVLLLFELLALLRSIGKASKATRQALLPIAELAETARTINRTPAFQLKDLTGTINTINAERLDTRIQVDATQNELQDLAGSINGMLDRINEAYRSQVRFVSDASHELRTPIAVIQGYANLLDRWGKNDKQALEESIGAIKSEAAGMKDLIEQLLFLARGDTSTMQLSHEEIRLNRLILEIVKEMEMIDPGHQFVCAPAPEEIIITGDPQLIKQAVRIITDNSVKYTPAGEIISIKTTMEGNKASLTVQDNGIGIPAEDLPHIFDRFFRSDNSRARKTGGAGLGLSIAKWIVDTHGGTFEILSRKDIGTRVTLLFPVKAAN